MPKFNLFFIGVFSLFAAAPVVATAATDLTIYSHPDEGYAITGAGYGWVVERRQLELKSTVQTLLIEGLPERVDPASVTLNGDGLKVIGQQYRFDTANPSVLLSRYVGQTISIERNMGEKIKEEEGTLLSDQMPLLLKKNDLTILSIKDYSAIRFPGLPGGLATEPSLSATIQSVASGRRDTELRYQSGGFGWWADYQLTLKRTTDIKNIPSKLHASLFVTNNSGKAYENAKISVVAGNVQATAPAPVPMMARGKAMMAMEVASDPEGGGTAISGAGDFYRYTLEGTHSLPTHSTTSLPLLDKDASVNLSRRYVYQNKGLRYYGGVNTSPDVGQTMEEVQSFLNFTNSIENGLGKPLPQGRVRVFETQDSGNVFIGEAPLPRLAAGEFAELFLGTAFDLKARRTQTNFSVDNARRIMKESIAITLKNHSTTAREVEVLEPLHRAENAVITEKSMNYEKVDANTVRFTVNVPAKGEVQLTYSVKYTWD